MEKVELGTKVKDTVTGFTGTTTARCEYLHSTPRYCVEAQSYESKEPLEKWFDIGRLVPAD